MEADDGQALFKSEQSFSPQLKRRSVYTVHTLAAWLFNAWQMKARRGEARLPINGRRTDERTGDVVPILIRPTQRAFEEIKFSGRVGGEVT